MTYIIIYIVICIVTKKQKLRGHRKIAKPNEVYNHSQTRKMTYYQTFLENESILILTIYNDAEIEVTVIL